jgi:hypothetical protein
VSISTRSNPWSVAAEMAASSCALARLTSFGVSASRS